MRTGILAARGSRIMTSIQSSKPGRALNLIRRLRTKDPLEREAAGYVVLDHVRRRVLPEYLLTDYRKNWYKDQEFLTKYRRFKPDADTDADRGGGRRHGGSRDSGRQRGTQSDFYEAFHVGLLVPN